jgi:hypothetical protein
VKKNPSTDVINYHIIISSPETETFPLPICNEEELISTLFITGVFSIKSCCVSTTLTNAKKLQSVTHNQA